MAVNATHLLQRWQTLKNERTRWDTAWQQLADLFLVGRWRSDTDTSAYKDPRIASKLLNSTGVLAMRTLAAGMQGGMTSPVRPWFRLKLRGYEDHGGVNAWLDQVTEIMREVLHKSNFYNAVHGLYSDLGTFGTGLLIETANEDG